jgi:hypothetical protein
MKELLRDPVIHQARLLPTDDSENPLDQLNVSEQERAHPLQVLRCGMYGVWHVRGMGVAC